MENYRKMASRMNQHMAQLTTEGIEDVPLIMDRMMGYIPSLYEIWTKATSDELIVLSNEFPGFHRYAFMMEKRSGEEDRKDSRPYDRMQTLSLPYRKRMHGILTNSAAVEREFHKVHLSKNYGYLLEVNKLYQQWLSDVAAFRKSIRGEGTINTQLEDFLHGILDRLDKRIYQLATDIVETGLKGEHHANPPFHMPSEAGYSLQRCKHCDRDIALLIYGDNASNLAGLDVYAKLMAETIKKANLPTYVLASPEDPSSEGSPSLLLKVHPAREEPYLITPDEWRSLMMEMSNAHCNRTRRSRLN